MVVGGLYMYTIKRNFHHVCFQIVSCYIYCRRDFFFSFWWSGPSHLFCMNGSVQGGHSNLIKVFNCFCLCVYPHIRYVYIHSEISLYISMQLLHDGNLRSDFWYRAVAIHFISAKTTPKTSFDWQSESVIVIIFFLYVWILFVESNAHLDNFFCSFRKNVYITYTAWKRISISPAKEQLKRTCATRRAKLLYVRTNYNRNLGWFRIRESTLRYNDNVSSLLLVVIKSSKKTRDTRSNKVKESNYANWIYRYILIRITSFFS